MAKILELKYFVGTDDGSDIDEEKFWNEFVEFVEARGWHFGGSHRLVNGDDEEEITCAQCQQVSQEPGHWICNDCKLKEL